MAWFPFNLRCSAPIVMISTILAALAFAIGHHAFYQSLTLPTGLNSGSLLPLATFYHISDQQIAVSIGNLFALLVKALLGIAFSTVFDQFAWKSVKGRTTRIGIIDNLFSVLKNGFILLDYGLWRHRPLSMLLACITWFLPVASVITPATLNVHMTSFSNTTLMRVPRVDYRGFEFAIFTNDYDGRYHYQASTPEVGRILLSAAVQGDILPIEPPYVSSSWMLNFHGPALRCEHLDDSLHRDIAQNVQDEINYTSNFNLRESYSQTVASYGYVAWIPGYGDDRLPFIHESRAPYGLRLNTDGSLSNRALQQPCINLHSDISPYNGAG